MHSIETIESNATDKEKFRIRFMNNGRDVRSDKKIDTPWPFPNKTKGTLTVKKFVNKVKAKFGFDVDVLLSDGTIAPGQMHLSTVRQTY